MKLSDIYNSICIDSSVENKNCILLKKLYFTSFITHHIDVKCLFFGLHDAYFIINFDFSRILLHHFKHRQLSSMQD